MRTPAMTHDPELLDRLDAVLARCPAALLRRLLPRLVERPVAPPRPRPVPRPLLRRRTSIPLAEALAKFHALTAEALRGIEW